MQGKWLCCNHASDTSRVLERGEFAAFILSWCLGTDTPFEEMAGELVERLNNEEFLKDEVHDVVAEFEFASPQEVAQRGLR